jgi:hypothetical protein
MTIPYRGAPMRLLKQPTNDDAFRLMDTLREHGANALSLVTMHYMAVIPVEGKGTLLTDPHSDWYPRSRLVYADVGQDGRGIRETCPIDTVFAVAERAFDLGFERVVLKPHVDPHWPDGDRGGWRGWVTVPKLLRHRFYNDYLHMVQHYADIAQTTEADLCMGTELYLITRDHGAEFWRNIATVLRNMGFTRQLTYCANWGWPTDPQAEWVIMRELVADGTLDYLGISAYWPFQDALDAVVKWPIIARALPERTMFLEMGWPNRDYAAAEPWGRWDHGGEFTTAVSGPLWRAALGAMPDSSIDGFMAWDAAAEGVGHPEGSHNLIGSGLEGLVWGERDVT